MGGKAQKNIYSHSGYCAQCGKFFPECGAWAWVTMLGGNESGLEYCSKGCCEAANAGKGSGSKGGSLLGGIAGGIAGAAAARSAANKSANDAKKAAERAEEEARAAERKARHDAAISAVKNFQFDESDDDSFNRSAILFVEDYKTCHPGLLADNDYKKAYTQRIENEIKVLKSSNSPFAEKLSSLYEEAKNEMKNKLKKRLIVGGALDVAGAIATGIFIAVDAGSFLAFFKGLGLGIFFPGAVLGIIPLGGITNKSKTHQEENS